MAAERALRRAAARGRPAGRARGAQRVNAATMLGQGKTVREAEIDAAAELADFWRFNVYFAEQIAEQQPISTPGVRNRLEQRGARGLRLRRHAVQLHGDRRQPADRAGADGQHGRLEAVADRDPLQLARSSRSCARPGLPDGVINFVPGDPGADHRGLPRPPRVRRRALHRLEPDLPLALPRGRRAHRPLPLLPAPGRRDGRQGLRRHARLGRPAGGRRRARARLVRVPGAEVLRGVARVHPGHALARGARARAGARRRDPPGRPRRPDDLHGRRDRRPRVRAAAATRSRSPKSSTECEHPAAAADVDDSVGWFVEPTIIETERSRTSTRWSASCSGRA